MKRNRSILWRLGAGLVLAALCGKASAQAVTAGPPLVVLSSIRCDAGAYCREVEDRDWHVRISGKVNSPAGIYVVVSDVGGHVIFHGKIPMGEYPDEKPYEVKVPKDGVVGDYLITILAPQGNGVRVPYTDLPFEVYGKTFFDVGAKYSRSIPRNDVAPGGLYFQVPSGTNGVTIRQDGIPWRIHALDGSVAFDVEKQGSFKVLPNKRKEWTGTFKGVPGQTYIIGHESWWFNVSSPGIYVAGSPERWFLPDPQLKLDPMWWKKVKW